MSDKKGSSHIRLLAYPERAGTTLELQVGRHKCRRDPVDDEAGRQDDGGRARNDWKPEPNPLRNSWNVAAKASTGSVVPDSLRC